MKKNRTQSREKNVLGVGTGVQKIKIMVHLDKVLKE